jgi:hypothetical protein
LNYLFALHFIKYSRAFISSGGSIISFSAKILHNVWRMGDVLAYNLTSQDNCKHVAPSPVRRY